MVEQITLYTAKICPYAQRVELALAEVGAPHTKYQIDLKNKPEWYAPQVNPASKVPAVAYGGTKTEPDHPSPDSVKIAESLVLLEFVADLYPNSALLPKDPVLRAKTRFFIETVGKIAPGQMGFLARGEKPDALFTALEDVQNLLPDNATFAVSNDFTTADAAIAPFLGRIDVCLKNDIGAYKEGEGKKAYGILRSSRFAKLIKYFNTLKARPSYASTFDEEYIRDAFSKRFVELRAQNQAA